jgi:hypothetical protein
MLIVILVTLSGIQSGGCRIAQAHPPAFWGGFAAETHVIFERIFADTIFLLGGQWFGIKNGFRRHRTSYGCLP